MIVTLVAHLFSILFDLVRSLSQSEREKELEIALLRQQIRILQRTRSRSPRLSWWDKFPLALLAAKLVEEAQHSRTRLSQSLLLFTPETVLRWHRELVRRKWTFPQRQKVGRPRIAPELEALIARLGKREPPLGVQQNRRGTAQARLSRWPLHYSSCPQAPAHPWSAHTCPAKQHLASFPTSASASAVGL